MDRWLKSGGDQDPGDDRRHSLSDGVCILGLRDFAHPLSFAPTDGMSIGNDAGPTIELDTSTIQAGGSQSLATKADVQALRDYVNQQFSSTGGHTHHVSGTVTDTQVTVTVTGSGAPTVAPGNPSGTSVLLGS
jgi:hypothetical protein